MITHSQWRDRLDSVYRQVRSQHLNHLAVQELLQTQVWSELDRTTGIASKRSVYPVFDRGYVTALIDTMYTAMYRHDFEFCYLIDGVLYTTAKEDTGKLKVEAFFGNTGVLKLSTAPHGHYWKGTDKPFFVH